MCICPAECSFLLCVHDVASIWVDVIQCYISLYLILVLHLFWRLVKVVVVDILGYFFSVCKFVEITLIYLNIVHVYTLSVPEIVEFSQMCWHFVTKGSVNFWTYV